MDDWIWNVLSDLSFLRRRQRAAGSETPFGIGRQDDYAIVVLNHQLLGGGAPKLFHMFEIHFDY
ncbi:hypothetical protein D3C76_1695780 [compost metagenome]